MCRLIKRLMKKNPKSKPFLRNMDLEDILNLIHEDLVKIAEALEECSSAPSEEFIPILVGEDEDNKCYIKSTDALAFGEDPTGVHVYADRACTTPTPDGEYQMDLSEFESYVATLNEEIPEPGQGIMVVVSGVITDIHYEPEDDPAEETPTTPVDPDDPEQPDDEGE